MAAAAAAAVVSVGSVSAAVTHIAPRSDLPAPLTMYSTVLGPMCPGGQGHIVIILDTCVVVVVVLETTRPLDIPTYVVDSRWVVCVLRAPLPLGGGAYIYLPIPKPVS